MGDPRLVAILDHFITAFREYRVEHFSDVVAPHAELPLYKREDLEEDLAKDEQIQFIDKMLEVLRVWRREAEQK